MSFKHHIDAKYKSKNNISIERIKKTLNDLPYEFRVEDVYEVMCNERGLTKPSKRSVYARIRYLQNAGAIEKIKDPNDGRKSIHKKTKIWTQ